MRVWPNDLDLNMHMNTGRYLSMMDIGRVEILARTRMLRPVLKRGWRPLVSATLIRYKKSLLPFERFTIRSHVVCWAGRGSTSNHFSNRAAEAPPQRYVPG